MSSNTTTTDLIIDDFDCILNYTDHTAWTTPDPWSPSYNPDSPEWVRGTWHRTEVVGEMSEVRLDFIGPSITVYGHSGPSYGSYSVTIDDKVTLTRSAYAASNASLPYALYTTANLTNTHHSIKLRNLGKQESDAGGSAFLLDFVKVPVVLGEGKAKNVTLEETDERIKYSGWWGNNQSGNFSGGGSTYTNDDAGFELRFEASTIYILGDKKNDHGLYTVQLDDNPPQTYNGISGCSGVFGTTCEQQLPSIKYFASNLGQGEHKLVLKNVRGNPDGKDGINGTFFDLDSIVLTVPTKYPPALNASNSSSGVGVGSATNNSATPGSIDNNRGTRVSLSGGVGLLWAVLATLMVGKVLRV